MSEEAYKQALEKLKEVDPAGEDRQAVLTGLFVKELFTSEESEPLAGDADNTEQEWAENLSKRLNIQSSVVLEVVDIGEGGDIFLLHQADGDTSQKQRQLATVYLTVKRICFDEMKCSSRELGNFLSDQGVNDGNTAANLKKANHIVKSGTGSATKYGITQPGIQEAAELIESWARA